MASHLTELIEVQGSSWISKHFKNAWERKKNYCPNKTDKTADKTNS